MHLYFIFLKNEGFVLFLQNGSATDTDHVLALAGTETHWFYHKKNSSHRAANLKILNSNS